MPVRGSLRPRTPLFLVGVMVLEPVLVGCNRDQTLVESPVTEAEATQMAENALIAFNEADYAAWSRDWSDTMQSAIGEGASLAFRDQHHDQLSHFVAIRGVNGSPGEDPGTYRWTFDVDFENGSDIMWLGFKEGSPLIEGI